MKAKKLRVYNQSPKPVQVNVRGQLVVLGPFEEALYDAELARLFMHKHPGIVKEANFFDKKAAMQFEMPKTIWVANMTGDPDAPKTIKKKEFVKRHWEVVEYDNPTLHPRPLKEEALGEWVEFKDRGGFLSSDRKNGKVYELPPYRRLEMLAPQGDWFLSRCMNASEVDKNNHRIPVAILSREPSDFEPDMEWNLDEMLAYLQYIDASAVRADSEADVVKKMRRRKNIKQTEIEDKIEEEKRLCMKRLYFRLVDPKIPLPTRQEFVAWRNGIEEADTSEVEAVAVLENAVEQVEAAENPA